MRSTRTVWCGSKTSGVPPSTASSAVIPSAAPFWLTISRKGAGKVFSRPTRSPMTFCCAMSPPLISCDRSDRRQVPPHHVLPVRPIVRPSGPDFEPHLHALVAQQPAQPSRVLDVRVLLAGGDHLGMLRPQRSQVTLVRQAG